jgi:hypothetical protein
LTVSMRFSAEPVASAVSTSSTIDKSAAGIAHPERFERFSKRIGPYNGKA